MITFFRAVDRIYAVETRQAPGSDDTNKLIWLFGGAERIAEPVLPGSFIGPRREMVSPWSTNAVEICQNMGLTGIIRIEEFVPAGSGVPFDPMLQQRYPQLGQEVFHIPLMPEPVRYIDDIGSYNLRQGLALSAEETEYLQALSKKLGRPLTDSEVFGFSQVNSEHCRHKIFNGTFVIDGKAMTESLFALIRRTAAANPNYLVSAYKDNVAFIEGPDIEQFAPGRPQQADFFVIRDVRAVISIKAETHNFPTTVEPFNGAATGSGGEIRDRMAGGKGSIPLAGTAVYMTSYSRSEPGRVWEQPIGPRPWLYHSPEEILVRASNGASDFGNKFGQPLICGSLLTFEMADGQRIYGYDKVIMMAGGIGYARRDDSLKEEPEGGQQVVVMGGDNYRIGMGGGAVSSVATGEYGNAIELNAVQRSNPEMQKRVFNAIRALAECDRNPIVSIHDHGAGGHLNSLSELVENTGGIIRIDNLPIGDPTLSAREIVSNESQERMGLVIRREDLAILTQIAERERAPVYLAGETTGDHRLVFEEGRTGIRPIDLDLGDFFGKPPRTVMTDGTVQRQRLPLQYDPGRIPEYLEALLQLEAVACKDWLTNKVDRAVSGRIAMQQTCGAIQLPLNNLGVAALDYRGTRGIGTSLGHAPAAGLLDPAAGSRLSIARSLTNLVWAPLTHGIRGVSLSANWMWPCRNDGEDARLYTAVAAASEFAIALGINIPTGKDSLSMTQKYPDGKVVYSPGTVIITAVGEVSDIKKAVSPALADQPGSLVVYLPFSDPGFATGGSSFAQILGQPGDVPPDVSDPSAFLKAFGTVQHLVGEERLLAGHDIGAGGLITSLLEMCFPSPGTGMEIDLAPLGANDPAAALFSESPGLLLQMSRTQWDLSADQLAAAGAKRIGYTLAERRVTLRSGDRRWDFDPDALRDVWFRTSYLLDRKQSGERAALMRFSNYKAQPLQFRFPDRFTGTFTGTGADPARRKPTGARAAIIREKGVNRDRDMAWALYLAGFDVKDVHMTDLISGREDLADVNLIAFVGGFSNSDVLGSAKGWAGAFLFNPKARAALETFYRRPDTLSLGVCNGCQLMVELELIAPGHPRPPRMSWNDSRKYECTFVTLDILPNRSVMLQSLAGSRLGIWVAHGEGKFNLPGGEEEYHIPAKFSYGEYPGNPNGSMYNAACLASADGRHLAIMPHLEDSVLPWQWPFYPGDRRNDEVTPWIEAFTNARQWIENRNS